MLEAFFETMVHRGMPDDERSEIIYRLYRLGRSRWPGIGLDREVFARYLIERWPERRDDASNLRGDDLFLACACVAGNTVAAKALKEGVVERIRPLLGSLVREGTIEEVQQRVLQALLVANGSKPPKLAQYQGTGSLLNWVRAVAARAALDLKREDKPRVDLDAETLAMATQSLGPEAKFIRERHREDFRLAFLEAFRELDSRDRTILRLSILEGLSTTQIASAYHAHPATARRWLASVREKLLIATRRSLQARLHVRPEDLDSMVELLRSNLDISVNQLLRE